MGSITKPIKVSDIQTILGQPTYNIFSEWRGFTFQKPSGPYTISLTQSISLGEFFEGSLLVPGAIQIDAITTDLGVTDAVYSWRVPQGVTSISIVCIGGGGGAGYYYGSVTQERYTAGAGGALAYVNNISVNPGQILTITAGAFGQSATNDGAGGTGGTSKVVDSLGNILCGAYGGSGGEYYAVTPSSTSYGTNNFSTAASGGTPIAGVTGQIGYNGGNGGRTNVVVRPNGTIYNQSITRATGGGGGAAGYTSNGGNGGDGKGQYTTLSTYTFSGNSGSVNASGGGGGPGALFVTTTTTVYNTVNITTPNTRGGGNHPYGGVTPGSAGQGGTIANNVVTAYQTSPGNVQNYIGYGGGGSVLQLAQRGTVRIVWPGNAIQFPSTQVGVASMNNIYESARTTSQNSVNKIAMFSIPTNMSINIIAVGRGGSATINGSPGGGGALAWMKGISVTRDNAIRITLNTNGDSIVELLTLYSSALVLSSVEIVRAEGGKFTTTTGPALGGTYYVNPSYGTSRGGGNGGDAFFGQSSGGGAGGYNGKGGSATYVGTTYTGFNFPNAGSGAGAYGLAGGFGGGGVGINGLGTTATTRSEGGSSGGFGDLGYGGSYGGGNGTGSISDRLGGLGVVRITNLDFPV